jgi:hypothetical protein
MSERGAITILMVICLALALGIAIATLDEPARTACQCR